MSEEIMKKVILFLILSNIFLFGQDDFVDDTPIREFQFIGYSFTRMTASNISPTNDILQGQVIGRLFGQNSTNTVPQTCVYVEQRFVPFFVYQPKILDGYATFRSLFKIDYTWGDQAYGVGSNRGGAINAGQINLQTLMANVEIKPSDDWNVVIGLQRLFDNVRDPNVNALQAFQTSSYKLSYWGTQAVGINSFFNLNPTTKARFGMFQLWENEIRKDDDVVLWMFDVESRIKPLLEIGADLWYVYDRAKSAGGISVLGQGLNSALAEYNGAFRLKLPGQTQNYIADLFWLGGHLSYNRDFLMGRWWYDAFIMTNFGKIDSVFEEKSYKAASVFGLSANAMISYKYGMTANDKISFEVLFSTGDGNNAQDGKVNSVITGNVYGSPVGIYSAHRAFLLFPDPQVVNRYYSAVHDISNMGFGVTAFFLNFSKDFIPNRFNGKLGFASAISNVTPKDGGPLIGNEINFELRYNLKVYLTWTLSAAYLVLGDFYNSPTTTYFQSRPKNPFVIFTTLNWLMF
jgi:hypothetical protein